MSKTEEKKMPRVKVSTIVERLVHDYAAEFELDDGTVLRIDPPDLWSDECREILKDPSKDDVDLGRAMMGDENWEKFTAQGGTGALFAVLLQERYNLTKGESDASSSS